MLCTDESELYYQSSEGSIGYDLMLTDFTQEDFTTLWNYYMDDAGNYVPGTC